MSEEHTLFFLINKGKPLIFIKETNQGIRTLMAALILLSDMTSLDK